MSTIQGRIGALDRLRGLLIVLMALDHANYFVAQAHSSGEYWGGTFPAYTTAAAFLSRLITHPAAPGFFFLMGTGAALLAARRTREGWKAGRIRRHLLMRGALLIGIQLLVINRAWELTPGGWGIRFYLGVLSALGGAMLVAAWLLDLEPLVLLFSGAVVLIATDLLTPAVSRWTDPIHPILRLLLVPGGSRVLWVNYPLLPWLALTLFGLAFGIWLKRNPTAARRCCLWIALGALALFWGLRLGNGFGNIRPRSSPDWIGFLNVVKYPPSLTFVLLTLGFILLVLRLFFLLDKRSNCTWDPLLVYGSTPLFFYTLHLFLYAGIGRLFAPRGTSLGRMALYWLLGLAVLYPLCVGFRELKRRCSSGSPLRLF